MSQGTQEFTRALNNLKARDVQSVAARMCRVLRDFPRDFAPRSETKIEDGIPKVYSHVGYEFDSVWNENVGSSFACVTGLNLQQCQQIIEADYELSRFLTCYDSLFSGAGGPDVTDEDWTRLMGYYNQISTINAKKEQSKLSYVHLGFILDQKTLDGKVRPIYDVYEFLKDIVNTDFITLLYVFHFWVGRPLDNVPPALREKAEILRTFAKKATEVTLLMNDLILDMAHQIDGFEACKRGVPATDYIEYFGDFHPVYKPQTTISRYDKIDAYQITSPEEVRDGDNKLVGWKKVITFDKGTDKRLAVVTTNKYRLCQVLLDGSNLEVFLANAKVWAGVEQAVYVTPDFSLTEPKPITLIVSAEDMTHGFDPNQVSVYTNVRI